MRDEKENGTYINLHARVIMEIFTIFQKAPRTFAAIRYLLKRNKSMWHRLISLQSR